MQEDSADIAGEIQKNNPFWDIYETLLTPIPSFEPPVPTGPGIEIYLPYALALGVAVLVFLIMAWRRKPGSEKLPEIYYDEKENFYYYEFPGEESHWMEGGEAWLPKNYYYDRDEGRFFYNNGYQDISWVDPASLYGAADADDLSHIVIPIVVLLIGGVGAYFWSSGMISSHEEAIAAIEVEDPYEGYCIITNEETLLPRMMHLEVLYDSAEGSEKPLAIARYDYLEGDRFIGADGSVRNLPALAPEIFEEDEPRIVGDSGTGITFGGFFTGTTRDNCEQGRTVFEEYDSDNFENRYSEIDIDRLKALSLGPRTGSYEAALFDSYDKRILVNASSANIRIRQYAYGDSFCAGDTTLLFLDAGADTIQTMGFRGVMVPEGTSPPGIITVSEYDLCGYVTHMIYSYD